MRTSTDRMPSQTLAQRICSLGVGDPCPCCGAPLKAVQPTRPDRPLCPPSRTSAEDKALLSCPDCGCEICALDGARYGVAA